VAYPIRFKREAVQDFESLPRDAQLRFLFAFGLVSSNPMRPSAQLLIKQMRGHSGFWRLTVGPLRAIYQFDGTAIRFYMFGERATIYQQFESRK